MRLNRTLARLRAERGDETPAMFGYDPDEYGPPDNVRYMTLAEARSLECNLCGQCCGSEHADVPDVRDYTFGPIPSHQWAHLNGGAPLIIPLTPASRPRAWQPADEDPDTAPPFRCAALSDAPDGTTRCALWQAKRPPPCDPFPVGPKHYPTDLRSGIYILLNTKYQRLCTWVDVLVCPDDSVLLDWRKADGTLRRLPEDQWAYVCQVFGEAYRDSFQIGGLLTARRWRGVRKAEAAWRR
jgi:hypothetical protein